MGFKQVVTEKRDKHQRIQAWLQHVRKCTVSGRRESRERETGGERRTEEVKDRERVGEG